MRPDIPIEKITTLPCFYTTTVTEEHLDSMGHMNIRWYLTFFDKGGWKLFEQFGMDETYYKTRNNGQFALKNYIDYWAEVRQGESIAIYARVLGHSAKRVHFMSFMVNTTTNTLASTLEALGSHADLGIRRTSPYPPDIKGKIETLYDEHNALDWQPPLCGVINA